MVAPARDPKHPTLCVLTVTPQLTVTIEQAAQGDSPEVHVHAGGQGLWLARMAYSLGAAVTVVGPFGGETGDVVEFLAAREDLTVRPTPNAGSSGAYVHDRRGGERTELARMSPPPLGRHELDDLYSTVLVEALDADVFVIAGAEPASVVPDTFFRRLAEDLRAQQRTVVADLSGDATRAVLEPGVDVLKMSHSEMEEGGFADGPGLDDLVAGAQQMLADGVRTMVVSRAADPTLVVTQDEAFVVVAPSVATVDHRGAGDSMTAGIAVGLGRGLGVQDAVRLGAAAGALNVTRRGLGTGRRSQIERFAVEVTVEALS